jgi:hypothetical protein
MNIEKKGGGSPEEGPREEYKIIYPNGDEALIELNPDRLGDVIYMEGGPNVTLAKMLSSDDVIKGIVNHEKGTITWEDGKETVGSTEKDVVFAKGKKNELSERRIVMVGKVDKENKTISFE